MDARHDAAVKDVRVSKVYIIKDWSRHFEVAQNKPVKHWSWAPFPVKHDGKGYRRVVAMPNAAALLGAWMLIVQVAAKCDPRGMLADSDGPLTAEDLWLKTGIAAAIFEEALQVFSSKEIGWILVDDYERAVSALLTPDHTGPDRKPDQTGSNNTGSEGAASQRDKSGGRQKGSAASVFSPVTVDTLRDTALLNAWWQSASSRKRPVIGNAERDWQHVLEAAECALEKGENPPALFAKIVARGDWSKGITTAQEQRASRRRKAFLGEHGERVNGSELSMEEVCERNRKANLRALGMQP